MKTTLQVKLLPTPDQHTALLDTMHAFNAACTWIGAHAFQQRCASKFQLQKHVYQEVRQRFGLSAQLAIRAIAKTVEAYKRDKSTQVAFRPDGAVVYDERIMAFHGLHEVSLMVLGGRAIVPMQMGEYQRVQFSRAKGQADLVLSKGTFYLLVTLETPEAPTMVPEQFMGVDLGIVNLAADSTGTLYSGVAVEAVRQRCQCHRASFQRTGTKSAKRRLKAMAGKESRFRRWVNHQIANTLVARAKDTKSAIVLEDLTGIRERITVRQRERNKHSGWSFRQLQDFIVYKAIRAGIRGCFVDPRNTSKTCSRCGYCARRNRRTQDTFSCLRCGFACHADTNAARILATRGSVSAPDLIAPRLGQLAFAW